MKNTLKYKTRCYSVILGLFAAFGFTNSLAQDTGGGLMGGDLTIGAKVGANFNQFSQPGTTIGGSLGGYARYGFLEFLEVQAELMYSLNGGGRREYTRDLSSLPAGSGSNNQFIDNILYINRSILLHTVELPISARLGLPELNNGTIVPKLILGGSYSFNFAAFENNDAIFNFANGSSSLVSNLNENVRGDYFSHAYSAHAGIALDFNLENSKVFTMEFRYRKGLNNINKVKTTIAELTDKLYSSGFSINFSYRIL